MSKPKYKVVEMEHAVGPAFYTEREWAADYLAKFECGECKLPDGNYAQGASACFEPVCIVLVGDEN
jgi:hypothetical protein